jgi:hypothetical protein
LNEIENIQNENGDYYKDMRRKTLIISNLKKQNEKLIEERKQLNKSEEMGNGTDI